MDRKYRKDLHKIESTTSPYNKTYYADLLTAADKTASNIQSNTDSHNITELTRIVHMLTTEIRKLRKEILAVKANRSPQQNIDKDDVDYSSPTND